VVIELQFHSHAAMKLKFGKGRKWDSQTEKKQLTAHLL